MTNIDIYAILSSKSHNPHYLNRYWKFIQACSIANKGDDKYLEKHHICPKASDLFPEYKNFNKFTWNKVLLTYRQHFIAHWMLWKAYKNFASQFYAFDCMSNISGLSNSHTYKTLKTQRRESMLGENNYWHKNKYFGKDNPFFGKTHTQETKEHFRLLRVGKTWEELYKNLTQDQIDSLRLKRSNLMKGENNPSKNPEVLEKISKALTGKKKRPKSIEVQLKISKEKSDMSKNSRWYNDGKTNRFIRNGNTIPENFIPGKLKVTQSLIDKFLTINNYTSFDSFITDLKNMIENKMSHTAIVAKFIPLTNQLSVKYFINNLSKF